MKVTIHAVIARSVLFATPAKSMLGQAAQSSTAYNLSPFWIATPHIKLKREARNDEFFLRIVSSY